MIFIVVGALLLTMEFFLWAWLVRLLKINYPVAYKKLGSPNIFIRRLLFNIDVKLIELDVGKDFFKIKKIRNVVYCIDGIMILFACFIVFFVIFIW